MKKHDKGMMSLHEDWLTKAEKSSWVALIVSIITLIVALIALIVK